MLKVYQSDLIIDKFKMNSAYSVFTQNYSTVTFFQPNPLITTKFKYCFELILYSMLNKAKIGSYRAHLSRRLGHDELGKKSSAETSGNLDIR